MFDFSRRINGLTYYAGIVASFSVIVGLILLADMLKFTAAVNKIVGLVIVLALPAITVYWLCLVRQRANDIGWHPLLVTLFGFFTPVFLVLGLVPGQKKPNEFGPIPQKGISLIP